MTSPPSWSKRKPTSTERYISGQPTTIQPLNLTLDEATAVVDYRQRHGAFREWGELLAIYGVDGHNIEAAKERMSF